MDSDPPRPPTYVIRDGKSVPPKRVRAPIPSKLKNRIYSSKGLYCHICGLAIPRYAVFPDPLSRSLDHVKPHSKGGKDSYANLLPAHLKCNVERRATKLDPHRPGLVAMKLDTKMLHKVVVTAMPVKVGSRFYRPVVEGYDSRKVRNFKMRLFRRELRGLLLSLCLVALGIYLFFVHVLLGLAYFALMFLLVSRRSRRRGMRTLRQRWRQEDTNKLRASMRPYLLDCVTGWEELESPPREYVEVLG